MKLRDTPETTVAAPQTPFLRASVNAVRSALSSVHNAAKVGKATQPFKDAPYRAAYVDRLLEGIEGRSEWLAGGGKRKAPQPSGTLNNDASHKHRGRSV